MVTLFKSSCGSGASAQKPRNIKSKGDFDMKKFCDEAEIRGPKLLSSIAAYNAVQLAWDFASFKDWTGLSCEENDDGTVDVYYQFYELKDAFLLEEIIETAQKRGL